MVLGSGRIECTVWRAPATQRQGLKIQAASPRGGVSPAVPLICNHGFHLRASTPDTRRNQISSQGHMVRIAAESGGQLWHWTQNPWHWESVLSSSSVKICVSSHSLHASFSLFVYNHSIIWHYLRTCSVAGPFLELLKIFIYVSLKSLDEIGTISVSILQMRKLKHWEIRQFAQGHPAGMWDSNQERSHTFPHNTLFSLTMAVVPPSTFLVLIRKVRRHPWIQIRSKMLPRAFLSESNTALSICVWPAMMGRKKYLSKFDSVT